MSPLAEILLEAPLCALFTTGVQLAFIYTGLTLLKSLSLSLCSVADEEL
jgi:hypothetical protein